VAEKPLERTRRPGKFVHSYGLGKGWPIFALRHRHFWFWRILSLAIRWFDLLARSFAMTIASCAGREGSHASDVAKAWNFFASLDRRVNAISWLSFHCYDSVT